MTMMNLRPKKNTHDRVRTNRRATTTERRAKAKYWSGDRKVIGPNQKSKREIERKRWRKRITNTPLKRPPQHHAKIKRILFLRFLFQFLFLFQFSISFWQFSLCLFIRSLSFCFILISRVIHWCIFIQWQIWANQTETDAKITECVVILRSSSSNNNEPSEIPSGKRFSVICFVVHRFSKDFRCTPYTKRNSWKEKKGQKGIV